MKVVSSLRDTTILKVKVFVYYSDENIKKHETDANDRIILTLEYKDDWVR
jgi:hypothetical protein